ncbi:hypothetical protein ARMGADRAFT_1091105 [Armillaria gallica]|uniref:Uncharacterized protein n=1 Tax=Armillaria gallica TaxID=47427 RepID=A0A2H3D277_ARMGA|nr:hypothetical protein ARMGADRAFT_1091105 [Armillaria gallica]
MLRGHRTQARRQAAEAQNHISDSLRIIPRVNSFFVLPNNIFWSTAVGDDLAMEFGNNLEFVLAVSRDERLNELDMAETCSMSSKGTNTNWQVDRLQAGDFFIFFAGV